MTHDPGDPAAERNPAKLAGLQSGRAVAAIMVVLFHANVYLLPDVLHGGATAGRVFDFGYAGVEFFFVLSGFIMMLVHRPDLGQPAKAVLFLRKRVLRIYPLYWLVMGALLAMYLITPVDGPYHMRDPAALLASLALWPLPEGPMMQVAWTLQHEMAFYLAFAVIIINQTIGGALFVLWMAACVVAVPFHGATAYPLDFLLKPHNLLFLFGIIAAITHRRFSRTAAQSAFWVGSAAFLALGLGETVAGLVLPAAFLTLGYGAAATLIVIGLAQGDLPTASWLTFLGDASYAIYLVHLPAMKIVGLALILTGVPGLLPPLATLILVLAVVIAIGAGVHLLVEKPLMRALTNHHRARVAA